MTVAEVVQHVLKASPELAGVTGPALVLEDVYDLPTQRSAYLVPLAICVGTDSASS